MYYPILGVLMYAARGTAKRCKDDPIKRNRAELALGCGVLALPAFPILIGGFEILRLMIGKLG